MKRAALSQLSPASSSLPCSRLLGRTSTSMVQQFSCTTILRIMAQSCRRMSSSYHLATLRRRLSSVDLVKQRVDVSNNNMILKRTLKLILLEHCQYSSPPSATASRVSGWARTHGSYPVRSTLGVPDPSVWAGGKLGKAKSRPSQGRAARCFRLQSTSRWLFRSGQ
ncbi:hypothetical protein F4808DRAFT_68258 [Astrocystis sublimbata]|nr:hypothetical protein F4808DRAFT_68258 [Astrocystis sublimbata]